MTWTTAWVGLGLLLVAAAWLRFHALGAESVWFDEAASWAQARGTLSELFSRTATDNYPPLHNLLLYASIHVFGDGEWALRLPSAILGTAGILAIYWVGAMSVGRLPGLIAATFLTFSPFHILYSQEGRMYALLALTAMLFAAAHLRMARRPSIARSLWMGITGTVLLYTHPFGTLYWISIATAVSFFAIDWANTPKRTLALLGVTYGVTALSFLPWAIVLLHRASVITHHGFWIPYPSTSHVWMQLTRVVGGKTIGALLIAGLLVAVAAGRSRTISTQAPADSDSNLASHCVWIFLVWGAVPILLALVVSMVTTPIFIARYVIASLPPFLLVASYGWSRLGHGWNARILVGAGLTAVLIAVLATFDPYLQRKPDWRSAAATLENIVGPGDCLLIVPEYNRTAFRYYDRQPRCYLSVNLNGALPATDEPAAHYRRAICFQISNNPMGGLA